MLSAKVMRARPTWRSIAARAVLLLAVAPACDLDRDVPIAGELGTDAIVARPHPETRAAFLAELSPLPTDALLVVYEVEGPGELRGNLEVMLRPGGFRRENWSLSLPVAGDEARIAGTTIQTPDAVFVEGPDGRGAVAAGLGALADAYLALDADTQHEVVDVVRSIHARVARAREHGGGEVESLLGVECRPTRLAAQDLCMWEATGLPLRYAGGGFELRAIRIELDPNLGEAAFAIPADVTPQPDPDPLDPAPTLLALASGGAPEVGAWLHPGLRLPGPWGAGQLAGRGA